MAAPSTITRYKMFPNHGNVLGQQYHSDVLPLPNVIRIEIMSPNAKAQYLGKFHSIMDGFRSQLTSSLSTPDAIAPFYAFFDPAQQGDIGFDLQASWEEDSKATLDGVAKSVKNVPLVGGIAGTAAKIAEYGNKLAGFMGLDNSSTGSCTMKTFRKSTFAFNKTIKCSWYMPEMEAQARVGISRLLKMAYVRNFDLANRKDYGAKIAEALRQIRRNVTESFKATDNVEGGTARSITNGIGGLVTGAIGGAADLGAGMFDFVFNGTFLDDVINGAVDLNSFFGGSLTSTPLPVRLTLGHILDIEPLVITNVQITGSKEQFMTTDGSNIPLFVTANITFAMWMNPDPNKGFVQWLGDDVFNVGYTVGESEKTVDDKSTKAKSSNGTKTEPNTTRPTGGKVTGGANNGTKKPKMKKGY